MQKVIVYSAVSILLVVMTSLMVPQKEKVKVKWMSVEEMHAAYKINPKPILVDVYTSWCGWCKVMDKQTYSNEKVAAYINEKYYAVKYDAESKDPVTWNGQQYVYNPQNKVNDMAIYLLYGQLSYPSTVFLSSLDAKPAQLAGFLKPKEIESPLKFFGDGAYKTKNFPEFMKSFSSNW